ncbi:DUF3037 domain-containing protein [Runella sp. SP2]|uniref:DUF3037 domain-containing protein n=1 Tax=Runella sp. SP2 TaxID=2268026 RepID=UPI000F094DE4|nr:DUF3037 domain-containing protein [Runella sp. SP2]AYQ34851.1 DUF3037 domain-containing protein [Runella sp. SP2]
MTTYEYQILRYLPDQIGGEFVNVGLVLFDPKTNFLKAGFLRSVSRVTSFFTGLDGRHLHRRLRHMEAMMDDFSYQLKNSFQFETYLKINAVTSRYLAKDDTAFQFSEVKRGIDDDLNLAFDELYSRLVEEHIPESSESIRNDYDVWQKLYRPFLEKKGVISRLKAHQVETEKDTIIFNYAWKNEIWHCYQPVTFDLKKSDSIKNKVYKWIGMLDELKTAKEELEIRLLTALPDQDEELLAFILDKLDQKVFGSAKVSVIRQNQAEQFASQVQAKIVQHEKGILKEN